MRALPRTKWVGGTALLVLVLVVLLAYRASQEGGPVLALSTDPISMYVVGDGKVVERRSGVAPAWSPDGRRLAYKGDYDGNVWVDDRAFPLGVGIGGTLQWTPDGRSLLFEGNGVRLLDVRNGAHRLVAPGTAPALSPDGRTVAYLRHTRRKHTKLVTGSTLRVVPLAGGVPRVLARTKGAANFGFRPQWLPNGTGVVVARYAPAQRAWAAELVGLDGSRRTLVRRMGDEFALSPDGRMIAYQLAEHQGLAVARLGERGRVYDLDKPFPPQFSTLAAYTGLAWSLDGEEVAFSLGGENDLDALLRVYALRLGTGEIRVVVELDHAIRAQLAWNPGA